VNSELFRTENLSFRLDGKPILRDVSLSCPRGGVSFIMGPSGAGKSTLLKLLVRLIEPSSGKIFFDEKPIDELSPIALRRRAVYVPQQPSPPLSTVEENILLGPSLAHRTISVERMKELLVSLKLPADYLKRQVIGLSGGEKYRVSVAMALALEPNAILLDEPTASLDPSLIVHLAKLVYSLTETGMTIVIVSHQVKSLMRIASNAALIIDGKIVAAGSRKDMLENPVNPVVRQFIEGEM